MTVKPDASASVRNREPILDVLKIEFRDCKSVLEIGSGTGQHAVFFGKAMPWLTWQTSDLVENYQGINSWVADARLPNVRHPILLDVQQPDNVNGEYNGIFSANTAHIMSISTVRCMFDVCGRLLSDGGVFCLYGPFNQDGKFNSDSNKYFHHSLRSQDPAMGIRNLEELNAFAARSMMCRKRLYGMPANNLLVVWNKKVTEENL